MTERCSLRAPWPPAPSAPVLGPAGADLRPCGPGSCAARSCAARHPPMAVEVPALIARAPPGVDALRWAGALVFAGPLEDVHHQVLALTNGNGEEPRVVVAVQELDHHIPDDPLLGPRQARVEFIVICQQFGQYRQVPKSVGVVAVGRGQNANASLIVPEERNRDGRLVVTKLVVVALAELHCVKLLVDPIDGDV